MKKLNYTNIKEQAIIDVRSQHNYQNGHLKNSLNLNLGNFKKYAQYYYASDQPILFVVGKVEQGELENLSTLAKEMGFTQITGYILANEIPNENLQKMDIISVKDFLNKDDDYILLDVRQPDEITRPAPEKNLVNIPFEDLVNDYQSLDKGKKIYTLCGSGNRSTAAASYLAGKGFKPAVIEGGMKAIQETLPE